jgi:hypothetical protein
MRGVPSLGTFMGKRILADVDAFSTGGGEPSPGSV